MEGAMNADLVLHSGQIYTLDEARPRAKAVGVVGNRILAVGDDADIMPLVAPDGQLVDLGGRCLLPGFIDGHVHLAMHSLRAQQINLRGLDSKEECLGRVAERAKTARPGQWLLGGGWHRNSWPDSRFPTKADLDAVAPENPVFLSSNDGHSYWLNSRALERIGVTAKTLDPPGGKIQRDKAGEPTGILWEPGVFALLKGVIDQPDQATLVAALRAGIEAAHRAGVVGIHCPERETSFIALQELLHQGALQLRVLMHISVESLDGAIKAGLRSGFGNEYLRVGGVKMFADGSSASCTAAMLEPYEHEPENWGIVVTEKQELLDLAMRASAAGISSAVHAIGDRANRDTLDVLAEVRQAEADRGVPPHRLLHRIEHAQLLPPNYFGQLAHWDVIASMQPIHATLAMPLVEEYWGPRCERAYLWRTLLDRGTHLVFGSDAPVAPLDPIQGIHAAVTRRQPDGSPGPDGWYPQQRLSVEEAVHGFTLGAAYASGEEDIKGSIAPGKLADFAVLSQDIFASEPMDILNTSVEMTVFDGKIVYQDSELA
jgi:hypothetical protein